MISIIIRLLKVNREWLQGSKPGRGGGGRVLLGILGRGVPPGFPNPDPISDQNMPFSTPVLRPGL